jgi:predicted MFS family arabinose efflux permease
MMGEENSPGEGSRGPRAGPERFTRSGWLLLLVLAAVQFTHVMDFMIIMPLGRRYQEAFGIGPSQFGYLVAAYGFSAGLAGLLAAQFIDRFDRKTGLLFLYAGFTVGTLLCAAAPNYPALLVARVVTGAFGGIVGACSLAIVGDVFPDRQRGTAMGVVMASFSVASIAGMPAGLTLANHLGPAAPFAVLGGLSLGVFALAWGVLPPVRGHLGHGPRTSLLEVLREPAYLRAYVLMLNLVLGVAVTIPHLSTYLEANLGWSKEDLPYLYLFGGLTTLVTTPLFGRLSDRLGKLRVFRVMATATMLMLLWITNLPPWPLAAVLLVTTLFMVVTSGRIVPAMAMITACAPPRCRGSFMNVIASVQQLAMGLASLAAAALVGGGKDDQPLTGYPLVGVLGAVATLASVILAGRLRPAVTEKTGDEEDPLRDALDREANEQVEALAVAAHPVGPQRS